MKMIVRGGLAAMSVAVAVAAMGLATSATAAAACDRACLNGIMQRYLSALAKHDAKGLPLSPKLEALENALPVKAGEGAWAQISKVHPGLMFTDPAAGGVVYGGAVDGPDGLASLFVRLKVTGGRITQSEIIFNHGKPGGVFAPANLLEPDLIYEAVAPPSRRSTRKEMIALVDGYMEAISRHDGSLTKFNYRCDRYASGAKTTNNPKFGTGGSGSCADSFKGLTGDVTVGRRFPVVDEQKGVVVGMFLIPHSERPPGSTLYVGEMFKIVDGKIRSIEEFSTAAVFPPKPVFVP
ncbi:MAG: hypothetical protein ABIO39_11165 [Caulobacteraceae bacterium]